MFTNCFERCLPHGMEYLSNLTTAYHLHLHTQSGNEPPVSLIWVIAKVSLPLAPYPFNQHSSQSDFLEKQKNHSHMVLTFFGCLKILIIEIRKKHKADYIILLLKPLHLAQSKNSGLSTDWALKVNSLSPL